MTDATRSDTHSDPAPEGSTLAPVTLAPPAPPAVPSSLEVGDTLEVEMGMAVIAGITYRPEESVTWVSIECVIQQPIAALLAE